jgi:hypothetical protein
LPWLGWEQSGHDSVAAQPTRGCWGRAGGADLRGRSDLRRGRLLDLALSLQPRPLLCDPPRVGPAAGDPDEATPLLTCQGSMAGAQARSLGLDAYQSRRSSPPCYTPDEAPASHVGHVAAGAVTRTPLLQVGGNTTGTDGAAGSIPVSVRPGWEPWPPFRRIVRRPASLATAERTRRPSGWA